MNDSTVFPMSPLTPPTPLALVTLGICVLFGIIGMILFDGQHWGINLSIFGILLILGFWLLHRWQSSPLHLAHWFLIGSGLFFTLTLGWHDSPVLIALNFLSLLLLLLLAFTHHTRQRWQTLAIAETVQDCWAASRYTLSSYPNLLAEDIEWQKVHQQWGTIIRAMLIGVLLTLPLLIVFGLLLMASDERFETIIHHWLDWGWQIDLIMDQGFRYGLIFLLCGWIAAMILRGSILQRGFPATTVPQLPAWQLGTIEIVIMLTMINLLFLSFVAVQFTYFFGGEALVQSPDGPTYAHYTRRGFFQLVLVAWLVISLLLSLHWLHKPATRLGRLGYQILAGVMVVVTMVIESSAAHRMYLYTSVYGLTELRFYTSVFMGWLVILFIWFSLTVLRGQRERFTFGSILTGLLTIACLHFVNPDALIAKVNLSRLQAGQRFDTKYITSLSADAVPAILATLPTLPVTPRCQLWQLLQFHPTLISSPNWRNWNWSRYQAQQFLQAFPPDCTK